MQSQQGYDRAITVFSPDGRLFQVEYAIETVRRGALALGINTQDGVIIAVDEKTKKLQRSINPQKLFQIDYHIGAAAAGYIPDARVQVDNARFFSQSNKLVYDEPVEVETVAKHLADQCQQYTQYGGARPIGVSLVIGGVDSNGSTLYLTDPSGAYVMYTAIAIGDNSDEANEFLEKYYNKKMSLDDAAMLAISTIQNFNKDENSLEYIKMSQIKSDTKQFEFINDAKIKKLADTAKAKYVSEKK
jgi:proteasome alpha subunit|tara:strand:- start:8181 stop:8915 length:735 start_codon:yes stop_codon:yes gene_type:complete